MKMPMSYAVKLLILSVPLLVGCRAAHNVAVSSFRVIDAPANYVRRHIDDEGANTTTTTTSTYQSDTVAPGQPIAGPPPSQRRVTAQRRTTTEEESEGGATVRESSDSRPSSSSSPRRTTASSQSGKIPYAKPVPGKPGYVYSPFDPNGGYVDVTGYASGSKAKDPYSGKIFIVP